MTLSATERLPPAVIVHERPHIRSVIELGLPATLLSPPGFALHAGCLWWQALIADSAFAGPTLLDCADAAGRAVEAMRIGLRGIVLEGATPAFARGALIAAELGVRLLDKPPPALDLAGRNASRRLAEWLGGGDNSG